MADIGKDVYKVSEIAKIFSVSPKTVHKWIKEMKVRIIRFGPKSVRIERAELLRLLGSELPADE